jgi:hypothetical protein
MGGHGIPSDVYLVDVDGGNQRRVTFLETQLSHLVWSGDGSTLAFMTEDTMRVARLMTVPAEGGPTRLLATLDEGLVNSFGGSPQLAPSFTGDTLFFLYSDGRLAKADGNGVLEVAWRDTLSGETSLFPSTTGQELILADSSGIAAYRTDNGEVVWSVSVASIPLRSALPTEVVSPSNRSPSEEWFSRFDPVVQLQDGRIAFGVERLVREGREWRFWTEMWQVSERGRGPEPFIQDEDGNPIIFDDTPVPSPDGSRLAWAVSQYEQDVWLAEIGEPDDAGK